ncbi:cytochrome P450 81F3-like protein [Tanacetum coccineum]|uniref:tRNA-intron lyase n=1 Tax=Tanacetum coccineum TaxID=301880 RepID=A0ABQ5GV88_9ASTR
MGPRWKRKGSEVKALANPISRSILDLQSSLKKSNSQGILSGSSVLLLSNPEQTQLLNLTCFGRPVITVKDKHDEDNQWFQFALEEAFYLCFSLNCINIFGGDHSIKTHNELWDYMTSKKASFPEVFKAYSHLRDKNWVVRSGCQYGVDFVAYRHHPSLVHSEYGVLVLPEGNGNGNGNGNDRLRVWSDFQCTLRLCGSVAKTLLILHVNRNGANLIGSSPSCLDGYSVEERTITRWSPERCREDQALETKPHLLSGKYFGYNYTSLPWAPYGDHWQNLRRISALEILSSSRLEALSHIRLDETRSLLGRLFLAANENPDQILDLRSELFGLMFNVMTRMMGGKSFYGLVNGKSEDGKMFQDLVTATTKVNSQASIVDMFPNLLWLLAGKLEKKYAAVQKRRDDFMQEWIDEFRADGLGDGEGKKTFLRVLLSLQDEDPEYYTDKEIKSLSQALLHGGINTSVDTMEWAMSLLLNNPHVLIKAQNEIDSLVGCDRLVNEKDLSKLSHLQCIINETLRMHPAAPLLLPHESSKDCKVGGYHIPHGTMLFVNVWAIQNDPNKWESPKLYTPRGRRRCPGENLAMRIVGLALASTIQCFDWKRVSEELADMTESGGFTAPEAQPLMAKYHPRSIIVPHLSKI